MSKELLLAKSNFKRKKSATITIGLLILLSTLLLGLSLLLMLDVYPNTEKYAKKLDAGDGIAILYKDINGLDDVEGIGEIRAKAIKQALKRMQEQFVFDNVML